MTEDRQRILSVGMTDYLSKPFTESDVCHIIEKYVINPAKIVQGISDIRVGQIGENKYGFDGQSAPIPKFVLDTPIDQLADREKKELEIPSVNPYNEVAYVNKHSNAHRLALFNEAYDGIEHVFKMLDNDYETTVELVEKLVELLREPVFEDLRVRIINNDRTGVQEIIHNLKGAVSNFRLTHMMDEFVKIKNSDWSSMEQIDEILSTIRELTEIIQAAFEQFKLKY
jgi:CheY-like chemotaxis protein